MYTLYVDTHSDKLVLVLFKNGKQEKMIEKDTYQNQTTQVMTLLVSMLDEMRIDVHSLSDIIVVNGPGSFTGIRIGVTIAKTLAYSLNIPIRVMSSLLIKAVTYQNEGIHWFLEQEKNGYYVAQFNGLNEMFNDYLYIKKADLESFKENHDYIEIETLDYEAIYRFSRDLPILNPHNVNPLYVKLIEVQK